MTINTTIEGMAQVYRASPDTSPLIRRTSEQILGAARKRVNPASLTAFLNQLQHLTHPGRPGYPQLVDQPVGALEPALPLYELTESQRDLMAAILGTFHHLVGEAPLRDERSDYGEIDGPNGS